MAAHRPAVVIVPGAWHPGHLYIPFADQLNEAGFSTTIASIPSLNSGEPSKADCRADAEAIRQQLMTLFEKEGKDVILVAQSYGGIPGGASAHGLMKSSEAQAAGVIGLIYVSAFVVPESQSVLTQLGGKHAPYLVANSPSEHLCSIQNPKEVLFSDVDPAKASELSKALLPHAMLAFESPSPPPAWADPASKGKIAFVRCAKDQALPLFVQDGFIERSGVEWIVRDLDASHSPFASQPQNIVKIVTELAEKWA